MLASLYVQPRLQQPRRVLDPTEEVSDTGFFRVHWHPKRSPQAHTVNWRDRIIAEAEDFVVVSKPWGVQVPHRVDNVLESLVACVTRVCSVTASPQLEIGNRAISNIVVALMW